MTSNTSKQSRRLNKEKMPSFMTAATHLILLLFIILISSSVSALGTSSSFVAPRSSPTSFGCRLSRNHHLPTPFTPKTICSSRKSARFPANHPPTPNKSKATSLNSSIDSPNASWGSSIGTLNNINAFLERRDRVFFELVTLLRVLLPALISGIVAFLTLPALCFRVANFVMRTTNPAKMEMLSDAVASFLSLIGLLYSILVGQVFGFLYSQQEALYLALFDEVTEAKSLLEQVALVSQGRTMYSTCLSSISRYVRDDLLGGTMTLDQSISDTVSTEDGKPPATPAVTPSLLLSARPADDPLEAILYLTSVGIPGHVYDTVRSLRQARARRLGALQRKVPMIHLVLLWVLAGIMMVSFPVLVGVGGARAGIDMRHGYRIMTLQGWLFGAATFAVVMTKMVLGELWRAKGGAYNVDAVLKVMVSGLKRELEERMIEAKKIMKRSTE